MSRRNLAYVQEIARVIRAGGVTPIQKRALVLGMIALRNYREIDPEPIEWGVNASEVGDTATSVYKYFDNRGILIYVGITSAGIARNRQHNDSQEWWRYVSRQELEHFRSRELAHKREVDLIRQFEPPFNKQHNANHVAARSYYLGMIEGRLPSPRKAQKEYRLIRRKRQSDSLNKLVASEEHLM